MTEVLPTLLGISFRVKLDLGRGRFDLRGESVIIRTSL